MSEARFVAKSITYMYQYQMELQKKVPPLPQIKMKLFAIVWP